MFWLCIHGLRRYNVYGRQEDTRGNGREGSVEKEIDFATASSAGRRIICLFSDSFLNRRITKAVLARSQLAPLINVQGILATIW